MLTSVYCITEPDQTNDIIDCLKSAGFSGDDISALMPGDAPTREHGYEHNTQAAEGAAYGFGGGALAGGTLGLLTGVGALAIPGIGPFVAMGPIMATLGGAALGGTLAGVTGFFVGMGFPEYEAERYEGKIKDGYSLVAVHVHNSDEIHRAEEVFKHPGVVEVYTANKVT